MCCTNCKVKRCKAFFAQKVFIRSISTKNTCIRETLCCSFCKKIITVYNYKFLRMPCLGAAEQSCKTACLFLNKLIGNNISYSSGPNQNNFLKFFLYRTTKFQYCVNIILVYKNTKSVARIYNSVAGWKRSNSILLNISYKKAYFCF